MFVKMDHEPPCFGVNMKQTCLKPPLGWFKVTSCLYLGGLGGVGVQMKYTIPGNYLPTHPVDNIPFARMKIITEILCVCKPLECQTCFFVKDSTRTTIMGGDRTQWKDSSRNEYWMLHSQKLTTWTEKSMICRCFSFLGIFRFQPVRFRGWYLVKTVRVSMEVIVTSW